MRFTIDFDECLSHLPFFAWLTSSLSQFLSIFIPKLQASLPNRFITDDNSLT